MNLLLTSVRLGGQFLGFQMGLNMASVMDPQTGGQSSVMSQFLYLFTVLVFFSVNGHHIFISALASSFRLVPPCTFRFNASLMTAIVTVSGEMFVIALKLAAPIMVALFLSHLCLGIVARTVPQVNILMIGFPVNIGFVGVRLQSDSFGLTLGNLSPFLVDLSRRMGQVFMAMIRIM